MKKVCILMLITLASLPVRAEDTFDTLQILERNKERIKATGDLRGESKLMKVVVQFRDNDFLISGNDYRYSYITVVPFTQVQSLTFSDINNDLPREMRESAPLFQKPFEKQDQRWLQIVQEQAEILLMLPKEPDAFLRTLQTHTGVSITLSVDGIPRQLDDTAFRDCRIVQTFTDRKGKPKTDDFACFILLGKDGLIIKGKDKNYINQLDIPYTQVHTLSYEHARQSSYLGRMPGFGAFRKARHWFVIRNTDNITIPLLFNAEDVANFREATEKRGLAINAQTAPVQSPQKTLPTLPEALETQPEPTTPQLTSAQSIRCTLGPGQSANWQNQKLNRDVNARFDDDMPSVTFENIDLTAQTARMRVGDATHKARVIASGNSITFITIANNTTQITSIFSQNERLISIHSHHTSDQSPQAGQFYGVAEIIK